MPRKHQPGCPCGCSGGSTKICVTVCPGLGVSVVGAGVVAYNADGSVAARCTTGMSGCCTLKGLTGRYRVVATVPGEEPISRIVGLGSGTVVFSLPTPAGLICCGGYAIPTTLQLTDAAGTIPFLFSGYFINAPQWTGFATVTQTCSTVTDQVNCSVLTAEQPMEVAYSMICGGGSPAFALLRGWSCISNLQGVTYSKLVGSGGCLSNGPEALDSQDPTSSDPFVITFNPVQKTGPGNCLPDPIGGTVVIQAPP